MGRVASRHFVRYAVFCVDFLHFLVVKFASSITFVELGQRASLILDVGQNNDVLVVEFILGLQVNGDGISGSFVNDGAHPQPATGSSGWHLLQVTDDDVVRIEWLCGWIN